MARQLYVNLPVKDLNRSVEFFGRLGFKFNPRFTDDNAACLILGENIFAMLLKEPFFKTFTPKVVCDAAQCAEVLLGLSLRSRKAVDEMVHKAVVAGGTIYNEPQDLGFMYSHGFQDPDHHVWEVFHMEPEA